MPDETKAPATSTGEFSTDNAHAETVQSEAEKWRVEREFRDREIRVKESELQIKKVENELKTKEHAVSKWRNPLVVAILAGTVAAVGNGIVAMTNGILQRQLEDQKSEQARILEMLKTGSPDSAAENLQFLLDAELISDKNRIQKLKTFLAKREHGTGPSLATSNFIGGGIIGEDDAKDIRSLMQDNPLRTAARAVGGIRLTDARGNLYSVCTAFLVADDIAVTFGPILTDTSTAMLYLPGEVGEDSYEVELPPISNDNGLSLVRVKGNPGLKHGKLSLAESPPELFQKVAIVFHRGTSRQLVVSGTDDCRVFSVDREQGSFSHRCDTGVGAAGAPVLGASGATVLGVHTSRNEFGGIAMTVENLASTLKKHISPKRE